MKFITIRSSLLFIMMTAMTLGIAAQSAGSVVVDEVKFENGRYVKKGFVSLPRRCPRSGPTECGNGNSTSVSVTGKKGDRLRVDVASDTGGAVFTVFSPERDVLTNASARTSWTGTLPSDGSYLITVYTTKSFTPFTLKILDH